MKRFACYDKGKNYLFDVFAISADQAMRLAVAKNPDCDVVIEVVPGNDLGINGVH